MENDVAKSEVWRVRASIREAIIKLTDDRGDDRAAEPAQNSQLGKPPNLAVPNPAGGDTVP